jgi:hypothetical protein
MNYSMGLRKWALAAFAAGMVSTVASVASAQVMTSADGRVTGFRFTGPASQVSAEDLANAKSRLPIVTGVDLDAGAGIGAQGYGSENHPFTTKGAYSNATTGAPTNLLPFRATGKLYMRFGASWFVCTASAIEKGLLVTAAHCVANFGVGFADEVRYQPARHGANTPYGEWIAAVGWVPTVYIDGTDTCHPAAPGVICANDVAIVTMHTGPAPYAGKHIGEALGRYFYFTNNQGYTNFLGKTAGHITQLGYPVKFDSGLKMIRTDSLGYQEFSINGVAAQYQVLIGSDQTGGSSGGPWVMNFGVNPVSTSSAPSFNQALRVVATTSWGYVGSAFKVQGASRFANNPAFPAPGNTNVKHLIFEACAASPAHCFLGG